jgi:hypothetical protein
LTAYLSRRGLEQLRSNLAERDLAVVHSVRRHRFLTARQIEQLHFVDHVSGEAGARVCRRVLARLTSRRVLRRLQRRIGGVRAGSASFVYALGPVGWRVLDEDRRRVTEPSPLFLDHALAVADAHVRLVAAERAGDLELLSVEVEPTCWRRFVGAGGARMTVKPDLSIVTAAGAFEDCWFLEIDRGSESPAAMARKCRTYEAYWQTGFEQERTGTFPLVLWVAPDEKRGKRVQRVISETRNLKRDLFRVTTSTQLVDVIAGGAA